MNIYLQGAEKEAAKAYINADRDTTTYRTSHSKTEKTKNTYALDISGTVTDNSAYAGHGQTAEEIMLMAGQEDVTARRNYMAVMSNSMSDEDFAKLQKEGFHPGSTDIDTVVTIVDHIKAALVKGGTEVVGYTDTMSDEVLCDITGSQAFANELKKQFTDRDIPLTAENVNVVVDTYHQLQEIAQPTEGSVKYMIENHMEPTSENLYMAQYSAPEGATRQGKGYYADGTVDGYYVKKPEQVDLEELLPQMEKVIEEAGMEVNEDTVRLAGWLVENGVSLNTQALQRLAKMDSLRFPVAAEDYLQSATAAIADGIPVKKADLTRKETYLEEIRGKRQLEETRLQMSVEANLKLLRKGISLDTVSVEESVELLKKLEEQLTLSLTGEEDVAKATEKVSLFDRSLELIQSIRTAPVSFVEQVSPQDTLEQTADKAKAEKQSYEKAAKSYEELMTAPRKDLGDSIQKAFRNVDELLEENKLALTQENRRAVRILGYNNIEINEANIEQIKAKDTLLTGVIRELKPGKVLQMIRKGINPVSMKLEDLDTFLKENKDSADEMESYSKFLYKLEKEDGITQEERSAYIGIYRLLHQLEKNDGAPLGAAMQADMELSLENLLTALRSSKKSASGKVDYRIDDTFGGIDVKEGAVASITSQIEKGFRNDTADIRTLLEEAGSEQAQKEYEQELYSQIRSAMQTEEAVLQQLSDYGMELSADHIMEMNVLFHSSKEAFRRMKELLEKPDGEQSQDPVSAGEALLSHLDGKDEAVEAYEDMTTQLKQALEETVFKADPAEAVLPRSVDVRMMGMLYKQLGFMNSMAHEENYEIPLEIDGTLTAVNLKIIHKEQEESKVSITLSTETLGETAAELQYTKQGISGYCTCSKVSGSRFLEGHKEELYARLKQEGLSSGNIYFTSTETLNLKEFAVRQAKGRSLETKATSAELYRAAKAFIGYIRETQKGMNSYEN